jgi:FAD/FMN-containing dehydrogenase/Fe-S oxidoreductase
MNASSLEKELQSALRGDVRFDAQAKALYATDASNYRQVPIGVVIPKTKEDVIRTIEICRGHNAPILSRGAGTSLAGQGCNVAVILDYSKHLNRILRIDPSGRTARVQPGVILDHLRHEAEKYGLTFGPDPATHSRCTLGGMIGNNSCGVHALMAGKTVDNVESLNVLTYDGLTLDVGPTSDAELEKIIRAGGRRGGIYSKLKAIRDQYADLIRARFPKIPRRVSGYNLDELLPENGFNVARALVGTEGTCVAVLEATLKLIPNPAARSLLVLGFPSITQAAEAVPEILAHKPIGLEGMDIDLVTNLGRYQGFQEKIKRLPPGEGWLLVEFGGESQEDSDSKAHRLIEDLRRGGPCVRPEIPDRHESPGRHKAGPYVSGPFPNVSPEAKDMWAIRENVLAATAFVPGRRDRHEGWEDSAVPPDRLGAYLPELRALYHKYGYRGAFYGHFGDGCVHTRIDFDLDTLEGRQATRAFLDEAADLVVRFGGSFSGEHGDGQARAELLPKMFGPELIEAFREFKTAWDPQGRMNPGKIVNPRGILDDLRMGEYFKPEEPATHFHYPKQENSFVRAVLRCVGVGKCRNEEGGLMCPSYMTTRDEKDSTRGRAHLLFEMLKGEIIKDGWKSEEVKEALDLCLSCKGCKSDCPTNVDMATYKAEFLSHYYEGRLRPRHAYAFGFVHRWLSLASRAPALANFFTQTPGLGHLAKAIAGMSMERRIPKISNKTFGQWFFMHGRMDPRQSHSGMTAKSLSSSPAASGGGSMRVMLWPDTFTNYVNPEVGQAAVEVLEHLGYQVALPPSGLCCGRPLYDYGFLDRAKIQLRQILTALQSPLEAGLPIIVLEPSCAAVFKDELVNLFPDDPLAQKMKAQTFLLSEFLLKASSPLVGEERGGGTASGPFPPIPTFPHQGGRAMKALLQTHCHQKSVLSASADRDLLERLGFEVQEPESGCCGMAGSFGFEKDHLGLSNQLAERTLFPAVRSAPPDTLIIADGFSCREQIAQSTDRKALHTAQIFQRAFRGTSS